MKKVSRQERLLSQFRNTVAYSGFSLKNAKSFLPVKFSMFHDEKEKALNQLLVGYPHNHKYAVHRKKLLPGFQLYERYRLVSSLFPENMTSFLDIGSCKGFYCMNAALRPGCSTAAGVDIHEPFISISKKVKDHLNIKNADFYLAELEDIASSPGSYGGPFQTVLLIGTYQYLFWGSGLSPHAYFSHREILLRLSRICTDTLLLSARLETRWLSSGVKQKAGLLGDKVTYTTDDFIEKAEEFFHVKLAGFLGKYPLFVMKKKKPQE